MITHEQAKLQLQQAVLQAGFHEAVIEGLLAAALETQWDSGTIEDVIAPIQEFLEARGIPGIGDTYSNFEALEFWHAVADQPLPWDPYRGDREAAGERWREVVAEGDTLLGFTDWWEDAIETARHNL